MKVKTRYLQKKKNYHPVCNVIIHNRMYAYCNIRVGNIHVPFEITNVMFAKWIYVSLRATPLDGREWFVCEVFEKNCFGQCYR